MFATCGELPVRTNPRRRGMATVELAVCLPVLVVIVLGSIEATNALFLKQRLTASAYEGARKASTPNKTSTDAWNAANDILTQFGVAGGSITVNPSALGTATVAGTQVTVTVTAPLSSNSVTKAFIVGKAVSTVTAQVVMDHQ